ncbi:MAG: META domain-containing protein [Chitinophagaceae bacterium]
MKKNIFVCLLFIITTCISTAQNNSIQSGLDGKWLFVFSSETDLGKIPEGQLPDLKFEDSTRHISGSAGCNKIAGSYSISGNQLIFGPMISTFRSCPEMEVEEYITHFLTTVGFYKIVDNKLYLYKTDDKDNYVVYRRIV